MLWDLEVDGVAAVGRVEVRNICRLAAWPRSVQGQRNLSSELGVDFRAEN